MPEQPAHDTLQIRGMSIATRPLKSNDQSPYTKEWHEDEVLIITHNLHFLYNCQSWQSGYQTFVLPSLPYLFQSIFPSLVYIPIASLPLCVFLLHPCYTFKIIQWLTYPSVSNIRWGFLYDNHSILEKCMLRTVSWDRDCFVMNHIPSHWIFMLWFFLSFYRDSSIEEYISLCAGRSDIEPLHLPLSL